MSEEARDDREVQEEMMIALLEQRGYSVDRGDKDLPKDALTAKVKALEERLTEAEQAPAPSPADRLEAERQQFGKSLLAKLNQATRDYYRG